MIVFIDEERAYLYWVAHHRAGFVLDCLRKPTKSRLNLHRATCSEINASGSRRTHWTTGRRLKACALDIDELKAWALEQAHVEPQWCQSCLAENSTCDRPLHLSHLDKEVLSFVLEVATLHLDDRDATYLLTVGKAAKCLAKTPGQLAASLERLAIQGMLELVGTRKPGEATSPDCRLLPTVAAMKTLPAFQSLSDEQIAAELAALAK
ncbi:MAG TPA: hypothetical protein VFI31_15710 [Pirellulales bacterium]|nr:hypothetical protein [Pirellulales bacterium]